MTGSASDYHFPLLILSRHYASLSVSLFHSCSLYLWSKFHSLSPPDACSGIKVPSKSVYTCRLCKSISLASFFLQLTKCTISRNMEEKVCEQQAVNVPLKKERCWTEAIIVLNQNVMSLFFLSSFQKCFQPLVSHESLLPEFSFLFFEWRFTSVFRCNSFQSNSFLPLLLLFLLWFPFVSHCFRHQNLIISLYLFSFRFLFYLFSLFSRIQWPFVLSLHTALRSASRLPDHNSFLRLLSNLFSLQYLFFPFLSTESHVNSIVKTSWIFISESQFGHKREEKERMEHEKGRRR